MGAELARVKTDAFAGFDAPFPPPLRTADFALRRLEDLRKYHIFLIKEFNLENGDGQASINSLLPL